jgi:hypothetical protein
MNSVTLLRISYWIGAIADFINAIAMVYPPLLAGMLKLEEAPVSLDARLALLMGASLMFGWTVLLIWADRKPVERKGVLLITICPVILGLALTTLYGFLKGYIPLKGAIPIWILQVFLTVLFLSAYIFAQKSRDGLSHNVSLERG